MPGDSNAAPRDAWHSLKRSAEPNASLPPLSHSCEPAPEPADAGRYRLTDASGQLTEKRLRSLLSRCPEWSDAAERARLASVLEAEEAASGDASGAAEVLRSHSCAKMRKRAMLCLAHHWRYRSDCWQSRGGATAPAPKQPRKRAAPESDSRDDQKQPAPDVAPCSSQQRHCELSLHGRLFATRAAPHGAVVAASPPRQETLGLYDRTFILDGVALGRVLDLMSPHIAVAARAWAGPHSAVQYGRACGRGMTWLRVRSIEGAVEVSAWLGAVCRVRLGALRSWRDMLSAEQLRSPAYYADVAYNTPDSELEALRYCTTQARGSTYSVAAAQRAASPTGALSPQDAAWVHDFDVGHDNAMEMIGAAHSFVAAQRMAPLRDFLEAAEAVVGEIARYAEQTAASLRMRLEWISEAAAAQGPEAGLLSDARKVVPPLVQRLRLTDDCEHGVGLLALARVPPPRGTPPQRFTLAASWQK